MSLHRHATLRPGSPGGAPPAPGGRAVPSGTGRRQRPAALPRVTALTFLDTGQRWDVDGGTSGWVAGAGYAIRVRLPCAQSLDLVVGYPLVILADISPFVINLALGWSY